MNFGYDEQGNRLPPPQPVEDEENDDAVSLSSSEASSASSNSLEHRQEKKQDGKKKKARPMAKDHDWNASSSSSSASTDNDEEEESSSDDESEAEVIIGEEPTQEVDEPLVDPSQVLPHGGVSRDPRQTFYLQGSAEEVGMTPLLITGEMSMGEKKAGFMDLLASSTPSRLHNAAVIGSLHHGKTSLVRMWIGEDDSNEESDKKDEKEASSLGYSASVDEQERGISIKTHILSFVARGDALVQQGRLLTLMDTPGHADLLSEAIAGMRLADAVILCVDVVESLLNFGERLIQHAVQKERLPVVLILTKLDRLIVELKLPPIDAYRKMRIVIDTVNNAIQKFSPPGEENKYLVSPENGTVCFSSAAVGFCFSLETFANKYATVYPRMSHCTVALAKELWGQRTFINGKFQRITGPRQPPTFVQFILDPLYKIIAHAACGEKGNAVLSNDLPKQPRSPFLSIRQAIRYYCGTPSTEGLDVLLSSLPSPDVRTAWLRKHYKFSQISACVETEEGKEANEGEAEETECVVPLLRLYAPNAVAGVMRVVRGKVERYSEMAVVDDSCGDDEACYGVKVEQLFVITPEGLLPIIRAHTGSVALFTGLSNRPGKHLVLLGGRAGAAALSGEEDEALLQLRPPRFIHGDSPLIHVDLELKEPQKLDAFQAALQLLLRTTPGIDVHRLETGEFTLDASGELHLDVVLRELRQVLSHGVHIRVSPPYVSFCETVSDEEGLLATVGSRRSAIGCTCGTLDKAFTSWMSSGAFSQEKLPPSPSPYLLVAQEDGDTHGLDELDAMHLLALGPDAEFGPSALFDDTLLDEAAIQAPHDKAAEGDQDFFQLQHHQCSLTAAHRRAIIAGFRAAVAAGPLVGATVRGAWIRLVFADLDPATKASVVLSHTRSAARQALLGARPRLMEPIFSCEVLCSSVEDAIEKTVKDIIQQRRGVVLHSATIPGTTLHRLMALVPAIDSFGLETQIRFSTHGQSFVSYTFEHWDVVQGDPYDSSVRVGQLEPAHGYQLARDFVLKTRFRKGLSAQLLGGDL